MGLIKMQLTVTKESKVVQNLELLPGEISGLDNLHYFIGRSPECHIIIDDYHVSRNHAQISLINNIWHLKKITKHGEVWLNGMLIEEQQIKNGDIIQISNYRIGIELEEGSLGESVVREQVDEIPTESAADQETKTLKDDVSQEEKLEEDNSHKTEFGLEGILEVTDEGASASEGEKEDKEFEVEYDQESNEEQFENNFTEEGHQEETQAADTSIDQLEGDLDGALGEKLDGGLESSFGDIDGEEQTQIVKSFIEFELNISGEYTNFDKYYINKEEVFIGRDPNRCQIILDDPESSQVHAVIRRKGTFCEIEDLNSTNGVILNGARINQSLLSNKDEFLIGSTSFRLVIKSELISSEKDALMPVEKLEEVEVEEIIEEEVSLLDNEGTQGHLLEGSEHSEMSPAQGQSFFAKLGMDDPAKRKKILIYSVVAMALWIVLDESPEEGKKTAKKEAPKKNHSLVKNKEASTAKKTNQETQGSTTTQSPKDSYENLPPDLQEYVRTNYELAKTEILEYGNFEQGLQYLDKINEYVDEFEQSKSLEITAKEEFKKLEELEKERTREQEEEERKIRVVNLLKKANEALSKNQAELTQSLLDKVAEIDPDNLDASQLKLQLDNFIKEQERMALKEAQEKARRDRLLGQLRPGKRLYLKQGWYKATIALEKFLTIQENDDDLISEATKMLKESQQNLRNQIVPLLTKARSLNEGQDLKGAYKTYKAILRVNPTNTEAIEEMIKIKEAIEKQAKRIYREAIVDESLNYLKDAKEKFQEVQQISPSDSPYHKRAENKLKNYTNH